MILSHLLSFTSFLIVVLLVLTCLVCFSDFSTSQKAKTTVNTYLIIFTALVLYALATLNHYCYPDSDVAKNTDFYLLEHQGYQFKQQLHLVSSTQQNRALWDQYEGELIVRQQGIRANTRFQLQADQLHQPIYIKDFGASEQQFRLVNKSTYAIEFEKSIEIQTEDETIYLDLTIEEQGGSKAKYYIKTIANEQVDTSSFNKLIYMYYGLGGILSKTKRLQNFSNELNNCYLLREHIGSPLEAIKKKLIDNRYCLFLSKELLHNHQITYRVDHHNEWKTFNPSQKWSESFSDSLSLFLGIGKKKSEVINLSFQGDTGLSHLDFVHSKKLKLKADDVIVGERISYFITSYPRNNSDKNCYLNYFTQPNNDNHFRIGVNYQIGKTQEELALEVTDYKTAELKTKTISSSNHLFNFASGNTADQLAWKMGFVDRRGVNNLKTWHIQMFLISFLIFVVLRYQLFYDSDKLSRIEMGIYLVLFTFLFIRLYLLWRISTLHPIAAISYKQLQIITNGLLHFKWTVGISAVFGCAVLVRLTKLKNHASLKLNIKQLLFCVGIGGTIFCLAFMGIHFFERISNLFVPIVIYYLFDITIIHLKKHDDIISNRYIQKIYSFFNVDSQFFIDRKPAFRWGLLCITFVIILLNDAGYGVMFFLFVLVHYGLLGASLGRYDQLTMSTNLLRYHLFIFVTIVLLILLAWQAELISWSIESFNLLSWGIVGLVVLIGAYWQWKDGRFLWISKAKKTTMQAPRMPLNKVIYLSLLLMMLGFSMSNYPERLTDNYSYIKYRASVLKYPVDELMMKNPYRSKYVQSILQASHNQWLIHYFTTVKERNKHRYMRYRPHFNQGASYVTQASDLIVPRYLIAEHSETVILLLVLCLGGLAAVFYLSILPQFRNGQKLISKQYFSLLGIPVLLFITAFFVWMSTTNRFTFFGQDFPLLPVASKITLVLTMTLFLLLLVGYNPAHEQRKPLWKAFPHWKMKKRNVIYGVCVVVILFAVMFNNSRKMKTEYYNISKLIEDANDELKQINKEFISYQNTLSSIHLDTVSVNALMKEFHQVDAQSQLHAHRINPEKILLKTAYEAYFMRQQPNKFDPNELIHVRKEQGRYQLELNKHFFFIGSPDG